MHETDVLGICSALYETCITNGTSFGYWTLNCCVNKNFVISNCDDLEIETDLSVRRSEHQAKNSNRIALYAFFFFFHMDMYRNEP